MVYIHVPFCKSFCTYCDFYSEICPANEALRVQSLYADALCREIDVRRDEIARTLETNTLYIGGGTPSVLPLPVLRRIVEHLAYVVPAGGRWSPFAEFTIEVNPEDIVLGGAKYVRGLLDIGVTRVSMGIQSLSDPILRWMNRRHDAATAIEAVRILREAGVSNLSLDLIFGLSQLDDVLWMDTVEKTLEMRPEHISAYQLSIEPGSALAGNVARGEYKEAPEDLCARQYDLLCRRLSEAGYVHYEISNFALPGFEARHNSAYWQRVPYVGLGPGAHSFGKTPEGSEVRSWNGEDTVNWSRTTETLTGNDIRTETIMLGMRTAEGLPESRLRSLCDSAVIDRLLSDGSLSRTGEGRICIPGHRFFIADSIILSLL